MSWNSIGLPAFNCSFCITGNQLYFEKDQKENVKSKKEEFTGQTVIHGVVAPDKSEQVFFLVFELSFCKGILTNAELKEIRKQPRNEYDIGFQNFQEAMIKDTKIRSSWGFRLLYKPYFYTLSWTTTIFVTIVELCLKLLIFCVGKILPIKI